MDSPPTQKRDDSSTDDARQAELDKLAEEFVERERRGEQPSISQYVHEHPALAEGIEDIFPVLAAMEDARRGRQQDDGPPREELGDYRLLREIGRGGMGVVYEAEQKTLGRHVALKILPTRATLDPRFLERFRLEAQAAARLQHPNIVPVIGYGLDDGVHYFTMQYIEGRGLDEVIVDTRAQLAAQEARDGKVDSSTLGPTWFQDVARMGLQAAEALAHAHAHGVLHRDVKPGNLMLDDQGKTWVTDFGLCKEEGSGDLTQPGDLLGTFRYMAPERFHGESDVRGDIYGVGITLYELLARTPAYEDDDRATLAGRILKEQPKRLREHDPRIPVDLERVVLKAMAHDPTLRYPTAEALAADLRAYLEGRPITARTPSLGYMLRVAIRRHRPLAFTLAAAALLLVASSIYYVLSLREKEADARFRHYVASIAAAETALRDRQAFIANRLLDEAPAEYRNFEWHHLRSRLDRSVREFTRHDLMVERIAYSPDSAWLAAQSGGETWINAVAGAELKARLEHRGFARGVAWTPSSRRIAVATGAGLEIWSWPEAERIFEAQDGHNRAIAYSQDGAWLVSGGHDGLLRIRDGLTAALVREIDVHSRIYALALDPTSQHVVVGLWDGRVALWRLRDGAFVWSQPASDAGVHGVTFVGADLVAATLTDGVVQLWAAADGRPVRSLGHDGDVEGVWSPPSGRHIAVAAEQRIHIWDPRAGKRLAVWLHDGEVKSAAFRPDGNRIAAASKRGSVKEWLLQGSGDPDHFDGHIDGSGAMGYASSGAWVATFDEGRVVRLWDARRGELARAWIGHRGGPRCVRFSRDSRRLATADHSGEVIVWRVPDGKIEHRLQAHVGPAYGLGFSLDDRRLFTSGEDGKVCVYDLESGRRVAQIEDSEKHTYALAVSHDGALVATGDSENTVRIRAAQSLELLHELTGHEGFVTDLAFQPGDRVLASASFDRTVRLWNVADGSWVRTLRAHAEAAALYPDALRCVAFNQDGTRIAAGSHSGSVMLWDPERGQQVATLRGHHDWVHAVAFAPDGASLVAASSDDRVRVAHSRPLRERHAAMLRDPDVDAAAHSLLATMKAQADDVDAQILAVNESVAVADDVREAALRLLHRVRGTPDALVARLWRILLSRDADVLERQIARSIAAGLARAADHMSRQDSRRDTLLALAQLRCGSPGSAIGLSERTRMLNTERFPLLHAVDLAILAVAHAARNDVQSAATSLARLDALIADDETIGWWHPVVVLRAEARERIAAARLRVGAGK